MVKYLKDVEYSQIAPSKVSYPVSSTEFNVEPSPPNDVVLFPPTVSFPHDISANPSWSPLSSSISLPSPPPLSRPNNISENTEWYPLCLALSPLCKMVLFPTYQVPVAVTLNEISIVSEPVNESEFAFVADVAALQSVDEPEANATDMSLVSVLCRDTPLNQIYLQRLHHFHITSHSSPPQDEE